MFTVKMQAIAAITIITTLTIIPTPAACATAETATIATIAKIMMIRIKINWIKPNQANQTKRTIVDNTDKNNSTYNQNTNSEIFKYNNKKNN